MSIMTNQQYAIFCSLIAKLHNCSTYSAMQDILISDVRCLVPVDSAILLLFEDDGLTAQSSIIHNLDPASFADYRDYYQQFDLYKESVHTSSTPPAVTRTSDLLDYRLWNKNEHRADFLLPQGIYHIACLEIIQNNRIKASLSLHRNKQHDNFTDQELDILRCLAPSLQAVYQAIAHDYTLENNLPYITTLTARERQILPWLCTKITNEDLACQLKISSNTLKTHIRNILNKSGCSTRLELITHYYTKGISYVGKE